MVLCGYPSQLHIFTKYKALFIVLYMSDEIRDLLESVAAGKIKPEEATEQLKTLQADSANAPSAEEPLRPLRQIMVRGTAIKLKIIGDPTVAEAVADGVHTMHRTGDALIINSGPGRGEFTTDAPKSPFMSWVSQMVDRVPSTAQALTVRVNPNLHVRALVIGSTLDLTGVRAGASLGVEAGSAEITDGYGPLIMDVASGSAKVDWTFVGDSKIKAEMGSIKINVNPASDVTIVGESSLGQATIVGDGAMQSTSNEDSITKPVVIGKGTGSVSLLSRMGSIRVKLGSAKVRL